MPKDKPKKEARLFGPFGYTQSPRLCPECRSRLVVMGGWGLSIGQGLLGRLGIVCHCVRCNSKYRAMGAISLRRLQFWVLLIWAPISFLFAGLSKVIFHWPVPAFWGAFVVLLFSGGAVSRGLVQWLWWASANLEHVTTWTQDSSFLEKE